MEPNIFSPDNAVALRATRDADILGRITAGRCGVPEGLAGPAVFLASPASDWVRGYTSAMDGGWLAR